MKSAILTEPGTATYGEAPEPAAVERAVAAEVLLAGMNRIDRVLAS